MATFAYNATFYTRVGSSDYGKIRIYATTTSPFTYPTYFGFEVISPTGAVIKTMPSPFNSSNIPPPSSDVIGEGTTAAIAIPLDSNGAFLQGTYTFRVIALYETSDGSNVYASSTETIKYAFTPVEISQFKANMRVEVAYATAKIKLTDLTYIVGLTGVSRTMSVIPPTIPTVSLSGGTTTGTSLVYTFTYTGVRYVAQLVTDAIFTTVSGTFTFDHQLRIQQNSYIDINALVLSQLRAQANAVLVGIEEEICGSLDCDCKTTLRYMKIIRLLQNIQFAYFEGTESVVSTDLVELYALLDITPPTTIIAPYTPYLT